MKKVVYILILMVLCLIPLNVNATNKEEVSLYLFYSTSCPHCKAEKTFLDDIKDDYPNLKINYFVAQENPTLTSKIRDELGIKNSYVPLTVIGSDYFIGYSEDTKKQILEAIDAYSTRESCDLTALVINNESTKGCKSQNNDIYSDSEYKVLPLIGEVNVKNFSLPFISIIMGFVDGFNPCAMWVLIFLITMLFDLKDRKKMWILGVTFLVASALVYLIFMLSWLTITSTIIQTWFRYIIALVAFIASIINLRSFTISLKKNVGCQVTSSSKRKKIITKIQHIANEKSFVLAISGIILLAFSINLIELACSAGLPVMFTSILSMNNLSIGYYALYMFLYILFFLLDDLIIFIGAMLTLKVTGISNKYTKYSHLIGGIIMLLMGILLAFKPEWIMFNF